MEWTALLLGFAGGLHCVGMCGPLVMALPGPFQSGAARRRLIYQFGRIAMYVLLGAAAGVFGRSLVFVGMGRWVSLVAGGGIAIGLIWSRQAGAGQFWTSQLVKLRRQVGPRFNSGSTLSFALLGAINGLLPCGLVYVACAAAATNGGILGGTLYMLWFGLGTLPLLFGLSLAQSALPLSIRLRFRSISPFAIALVAGLLIVRGLGLGIPYLSPAWSAGGSSCALCH